MTIWADDLLPLPLLVVVISAKEGGCVRAVGLTAGDGGGLGVWGGIW